RVRVEMMNNVPAGVKKPSGANESVGAESSVREVCRKGRVCKLPRTQPSAEIGSTCTSNDNRVEFAATWLPDQRSQRDEDERDDAGRRDIPYVDRSCSA